jgi:hypothetical protein
VTLPKGQIIIAAAQSVSGQPQSAALIDNSELDVCETNYPKDEQRYIMKPF